MTFLIITGYLFLVLGFITAVQCSYCSFSGTTYSYSYCEHGCCEYRCCTSSAGAIIGGICAGIAVILIICVVIACYCRRRRAQSGIVVNPNPAPPVSTVIIQGNQYPMQPIQLQQGQHVLQYQNMPIHPQQHQMGSQHNAGNQNQLTTKTHQPSGQGQQMTSAPSYNPPAYSPRVPTEPLPTSDDYLHPISDNERPYDSLTHNNSQPQEDEHYTELR